MFKKIAIILATLMLVMSCSNTAPNDEPKDNPSASSSGNGSQLYGPPIYDAYLFTVRKEIPHLLILRDGVVIKAGKEVCDALEEASPLSTEEFVFAATRLSQGSDGIMTPKQSAYFMGASAGAFCPDIADEIRGLTGSGV